MSFKSLPNWIKERILSLLIDEKGTYLVAICVCNDFYFHLSIIVQKIKQNILKIMGIDQTKYLKINEY
uniref:Uncharacterized protein n=1 Tax=viral metagenome TaxID=1070528 RepID=A0A6C0LQN3_9ZZZZ